MKHGKPIAGVVGLEILRLIYARVDKEARRKHRNR